MIGQGSAVVADMASARVDVVVRIEGAVPMVSRMPGYRDESAPLFPRLADAGRDAPPDDNFTPAQLAAAAQLLRELQGQGQGQTSPPEPPPDADVAPSVHAHSMEPPVGGNACAVPVTGGPPVYRSAGFVTVGGQPRPLKTLADAFDQCCQVKRKWRPATRGLHQTTVRKWELFHYGPGPDVSDITSNMAERFVMKSWHTHESRIKNLGQFFTLLNSVAPKDSRHRYGMSHGDAWIREIPYFELIDSSRDVSAAIHFDPLETLTLSQIGDLYDAAPQIDGGDGRLRLGLQAGLVAAATYGWRMGNWIGMRFDNFDLARRVFAYRCCKTGRLINGVMSEDYARHVSACRAAYGTDCEFVHGFKRWQQTKMSERVYPQIRKLFELADVPVPCRMTKAGKLKQEPMHGFRRYAAGVWHDFEPRLQHDMLGHSHGSDVSNAVYAKSGKARLARQRLPDYPSPPQFRTGPVTIH